MSDELLRLMLFQQAQKHARRTRFSARAALVLALVSLGLNPIVHDAVRAIL